jgi:beta-lactam-binding protein with PASTA domain
MKQARRKRRRSPVGVIIVVILAIIALAALFNWVLMPLIVARGRETTVPAIVGMSRDEAEVEIAKAGLRLEGVNPVTNSSVPTDHVVSQQPRAGQVVKVGRGVQLDISSGAGWLKVPHVEGLSVARATALLSEAGLHVAMVESLRTPNIPAGQVVSTRPPAGSNTNEGEAIFIQVSARFGSFPMPDLVGMSADAAQGIVSSQGLVLGEKRLAPSDEPTGNVLVQYPEEGMMVRTGDSVHIIVSGGAKK